MFPGDSCCDVVAGIYAYYAHIHQNVEVDELQRLKEMIVVNQQQSEAAKRSRLVHYTRAHRVHARQWLPLEEVQTKVKPYSFGSSGLVRIGFKVSNSDSAFDNLYTCD